MNFILVIAKIILFDTYLKLKCYHYCCKTFAFKYISLEMFSAPETSQSGQMAKDVIS